MNDYQNFLRAIEGTPLRQWRAALEKRIDTAFDARGHGKMADWLCWQRQLPALTPSRVSLKESIVTIGVPEDASAEQSAELERVLRLFHPWRKGPFEVFGVAIDTEWRSDWKWDRLRDHIEPLTGRRVLDVGCGSGYHCWRMRGEGAQLVVGIDPTMLYVMQFLALKRYLPHEPVYVLPLRSAELPDDLSGFDTVFSMGVFYHCRSPFDHLLELRSRLGSAGELVLETLVVDGPQGYVLVPEGRYAKMRNVWCIPSCLTMESWLRRCAYRDIRVIDVMPTTPEEQRATSWMNFESLADFLDPEDSGKTIEGYPAPLRAIFLARVY